MKTKHALLLGCILTVVAVAYAAMVYPNLGDKIPTHWDWRGEVNGWMPKSTGAFFVPALMVLFVVLTGVLPWLSPRNFMVDTFRETFNYVMVVVVGLLAYLHIVMLRAGLYGTDLRRALFVGLFLFIAVLGNVLGKVRRNFWMGVRTPWTLASDSVWIATHRLAARLFVAFGVLGAAAVWLRAPVGACFVVFMAVMIIPVVYSLVLYKQLEAKGQV